MHDQFQRKLASMLPPSTVRVAAVVLRARAKATRRNQFRSPFTDWRSSGRSRYQALPMTDPSPGRNQVDHTDDARDILDGPHALPSTTFTAHGPGTDSCSTLRIRSHTLWRSHFATHHQVVST